MTKVETPFFDLYQFKANHLSPDRSYGKVFLTDVEMGSVKTRVNRFPITKSSSCNGFVSLYLPTIKIEEASARLTNDYDSLIKMKYWFEHGSPLDGRNTDRPTAPRVAGINASSYAFVRYGGEVGTNVYVGHGCCAAISGISGNATFYAPVFNKSRLKMMLDYYKGLSAILPYLVIGEPCALPALFSSSNYTAVANVREATDLFIPLHFTSNSNISGIIYLLYLQFIRMGYMDISYNSIVNIDGRNQNLYMYFYIPRVYRRIIRAVPEMPTYKAIMYSMLLSGKIISSTYYPIFEMNNHSLPSSHRLVEAVDHRLDDGGITDFFYGVRSRHAKSLSYGTIFSLKDMFDEKNQKPATLDRPNNHWNFHDKHFNKANPNSTRMLIASVAFTKGDTEVIEILKQYV